MILVSGYNLYPPEIGEVLHRHPGGLEATVAGVQDEYRGPKPYAHMSHEHRVDAAQFNVYCSKYLAPDKVSRSYEFVDILPRTSVGKVDKLALRQLVISDSNTGKGASS